MAEATATTKILEFITGEEEGRACEAIPDSACTNVPRNFTLNVLNGACTKFSEQLANPGLVLPWLLSALGAPAFLAGWLLPVRRGGSMLPQLFVSGSIRSVPLRKWFWTAAGVTQAVVLGLMIPAALFLDPLTAGWTILGLMALFAVASGVGSVAFSDVMGKTIPKRRRGRLLGLRATIGGVFTVLAGLGLKLYLGPNSSLEPYMWLLAGAAILWALAAVLFGMILETPGATEGGRNLSGEIASGFSWAKQYTGFRRFLYTRAMLLLAVELALPFYALHARAVVDNQLGTLGIFVLVSGLSATLSSTIWGRYSDSSSRNVMVVAGGIGAFTAICALLFTLLPDQWQEAWVYAPVFFLHGLALAGVRLGRKTYLVDAAPEEERPTYIAFSNSLIGLLTFAGGALGFIGQAFGMNVQVTALLVLSVFGIVAALLTPQPERMLDEPA